MDRSNLSETDFEIKKQSLKAAADRSLCLVESLIGPSAFERGSGEKLKLSIQGKLKNLILERYLFIEFLFVFIFLVLLAAILISLFFFAWKTVIFLLILFLFFFLIFEKINGFYLRCYSC